MLKTLLYILFFTLPGMGWAQQFQLSGYIKDEHQRPVAGATLYLAGYKKASLSDDKGYFNFQLAAGGYDILVQMIGYKPKQQAVSLVADLQIQIGIEEQQIALNTVTIGIDKTRPYNLEEFKRLFLGSTMWSKYAEIENTENLNIYFDHENKTLEVSSTEYLRIKNPQLGYHIKYLLKDFVMNYKTQMLYFEGYPIYEEMRGSKRQQKKWEAARLLAYKGSMMHFLRSLHTQNLQEEGFELYKVARYKNPDRSSDEAIALKLKSFYLKNEKAALVLQNDSIAKYNQLKKLPAEIALFDARLVKPDSLIQDIDENSIALNYAQYLFVAYTKAAEPEAYLTLPQRSLSRPPALIHSQASMLGLISEPLKVFSIGILEKPRQVVVEGYWTWQKIADSLPLDYSPSVVLKN